MPHGTRLLVLGLALAACGGGDKKNNTPDAPNNTVDSTTPDAPRTCATVQITNTDFGGYDATNNIIAFTGDGGDAGDGNPLKVSLEFYGGIETSLMGTFDLTQGNQNNYATCALCVRAYSQDAQGNLIKEFFQSGGSVTLSEDPLTNQHLVATFTNLQLQEVTIDRMNGFTSTPVAGGLCTAYGSPSIDHDKVPNAWTCTHSAYQDGAACDCICGLADPDCATRQATTNGCTGNQVCQNDACVAPAANDMCAAATTLTLGTAMAGTTVGAYNDYSNGLEAQATCTGFHQAGADVAYKVNLTANTQYTVTLSGLAADFDASVALLGPGNATVCDPDPITACVAGKDAGAEGADETFTYTPTTTGTYYVIVDSFYTTESGAFTIKVQ